MSADRLRLAERQLAKTHCPAGHPYDEANTYRRRGDNRRYCRKCKAGAVRKIRARRKAATS
jgi:hypothetical protein